MSEAVNLRTIVSLWTYEHYADAADAFALVRDGVYQSVGVGIALARNVFLYPNLQFLPGNMRASLTNLGMNATINLF